MQTPPASTLSQTPLPTNYWTTPINAQNQLWYTISGNWLAQGLNGFQATNYNGTGNFNAYTTAPNSPHILWTKPLQDGGLIGGEFGGTDTSNYYTGKSYQSEFFAARNHQRSTLLQCACISIRKKDSTPWIYAQDRPYGSKTLLDPSWPDYSPSAGLAEFGTAISLGQIYNYLTPNQEGRLSILMVDY